MELSHARRASVLRGSTASHPRSTPPAGTGPIAVLSDYRRADLPVAQTSLSIALRLRLSLLGLALGVVALAAATALALLIVAGPFHTSIGSLG